MAFYDKFPYSNFHELNTDWIIQKIKHIDDSVEESAASAEASAASASASEESAQASAASAEAAAASEEAAAGSETAAAESAAGIEAAREQIYLNTARLDNLIVDGTPTEGNTELLDIRVGANGVTYPTAGDAVRGQYNELKQSLSDTEAMATETRQSIADRNLFDKSKATLNKTYNINWEIIDQDGSDLTDFIPVQEGKTLFVSNAAVAITTNYLVYYLYTFDINKKPIQRTTIATTPNPTYTIASGVAFVRYCYSHSIINGFQIQYDKIDHYTKYNSNELRTVLEDVPANLLICDKETATINGVTFTNYGNGRIQVNGTASNDVWADYYSADISNIDAAAQMTLGCHIVFGSVDGLILKGYFRENRTSPALKSITSANGVPETFAKNIYESPDDAKVLTLSLHLQQGAVVNCIIDPTLVMGDKMVGNILNGKIMTPRQYSDYKAFDDNGWKLRMFNNAVFIGDSVTEGFIVDGDTYEVESAYSYPTQFGKTNSWMNITNKGVTGYSPYQIFNNVIPTIDPSDYDVAIIEMGYNGTDKGYLNINDYDTPDTNTYYYRRVINYMRANPDITIFIVCSSRATNNGSAGDWLPVLNKIASDYGCKVINLLDTKYLNLNNDIYHGQHDGNMDYIHFNRRGYNAKAYVVSRMMADELI